MHESGAKRVPESEGLTRARSRKHERCHESDHSCSTIFCCMVWRQVVARQHSLRTALQAQNGPQYARARHSTSRQRCRRGRRCIARRWAKRLNECTREQEHIVADYSMLQIGCVLPLHSCARARACTCISIRWVVCCALVLV